jgi:hypothetical protein
MFAYHCDMVARLITTSLVGAFGNQTLHAHQPTPLQQPHMGHQWPIKAARVHHICGRAFLL